jgi:hypothetical protein
MPRTVRVVRRWALSTHMRDAARGVYRRMEFSHFLTYFSRLDGTYARELSLLSC